ncbi:hypothetical protein BJV82DRAFT_623524 [Fennellomyces sp. T-0311]|nr:hypothetical protein BJV82DRAFT_623524 [Fennellomyces sp. T-0311]
MSHKKRKAPECDILMDKRLATDIVQRQEQNLFTGRDFVADCAFEIMCNVLCRLDFETISECLQVSRTWQCRISAVSDIWRKIEFTTRNPWLDKQPLSAFSFVSEHVEEVCFDSLPENLAICIEALADHELPKLRSLKLISSGSSFRSGTKLVRPIYSTITRFKKALKELHLVTDDNSPLCIKAILSRCPNLTAIKVVNNRFSDRGEELTKPHSSLLSIEIGGAFIKIPKILGIIRSIPKIRHVVIDTFQIDDLLPDILQHCPQLSMIGNQPLAFQHIKDNILQSSTKSEGNEGIQCIAFEHLSRVQCVLPLLEKARPTLKYIYLRISKFSRADPGWKLLSSFSIPQLTELHLVDHTNSLISNIAPVIQHFPSLKAVHLENVNVRWTTQLRRTVEEIFAALMGLEHLSALSLTEFDLRSQTFVQLLEHCRELNSLTLLSIVRCMNLTPSAVHLATSIQSLEYLHFTDSLGSICEADMNEFARMIEHHPRLHHLKLTHLELSDIAARSISKSKSLRNLYFSKVELPSTTMQLLWSKITMNYIMDDDFRWVMYH